MGRHKIHRGSLAQRAFRFGVKILTQLEVDGADFVSVDEHHKYMWCREQLVNLYDHQYLIHFLQKCGYIKPRTENKMIIAAAVIMGGIERCA